MDVITEMGLLLPTASMSLAASSPAGVAAIGAFGRPAPAAFDEAFEDWEHRLPESGEEEDLLALAAGRRIAAVAARAEGWLSLTYPGTSESTPAVLLVGPDAHLVAVLHGETVEWLAGDTTLAPRIVRAAVADMTETALMVTAFRGENSIAGLLIEDGSASVAGRDEETLWQLTEAAADGPGRVVGALADFAMGVGR